MESVGTGTSNDIGGRTQSVSKLSIGIVSENSEFGYGIYRRFKNEASIHAVEIICSVDQKIVGLGALAIHSVGLSRAQRSSRFRQTRSKRHHAWLQQSELGKVATVQRQVEDFALSDRLTQAGDRALDQLRVCIHLQYLALGADGEMNWNGGGLVYVQCDALLNVLLETFGFNLQFVMTDGQLDQDIGSAGIGVRGTRQPCLDLPWRSPTRSAPRRCWGPEQFREYFL